MHIHFPAALIPKDLGEIYDAAGPLQRFESLVSYSAI